jgi:hypothetical protein
MGGTEVHSGEAVSGNRAGCFTGETKSGLLKIVQRLKRDAAIDGVILACTELPLILTQDQYCLPFLNTTENPRAALETYQEGKIPGQAKDDYAARGFGETAAVSVRKKLHGGSAGNRASRPARYTR